MSSQIKIIITTPIKQSRTRRFKTVGSDSFLQNSESADKNSARTRIRSVICMTNGFNELSSELGARQGGHGLTASAVKTVDNLDQYEQEDQILTTDFASDWSRMEINKRQTYSKLRNKLVKKFPSYRERYKKQQVDSNGENENQQPVKERETKSSRSQTKQTKHYYIPTPATPQKLTPIPVFKTACFYSRSQKKCLYNSFSQPEPIQQHIEPPLPRMSFMNYIKDHKQLHQLKSRKIKGLNLMKAKDKILGLEKQGTKSYMNLKKCLEQSIDACMRIK